MHLNIVMSIKTSVIALSEYRNKIYFDFAKQTNNQILIKQSYTEIR